MTETAPPARRLPAWAAWPLCVVLGAGLGWVCRFPLTWTYLAARVVAQDAGWAPFDGTFDEGAGLWVTSAGVLWLVFALVPGSLTWLAWRVSRVSARRWWWATAVLWAGPFLVLDVPDLP